LDDRDVWTGDWPGWQECREFGWYARVIPGKGWCPCEANAPDAQPDLNRLPKQAEWDRLDKRYVRTILTEAFGEMERRGILLNRGWESTRKQAVAELARRAVHSLDRGTPVLGYAFYTLRGRMIKGSGKDFALHFGQFEHCLLRSVGLAGVEVGKAVCECLRKTRVKFCWDPSPDRPIRVITASIAPVS